MIRIHELKEKLTRIDRSMRILFHLSTCMPIAVINHFYKHIKRLINFTFKASVSIWLQSLHFVKYYFLHAWGLMDLATKLEMHPVS